jgi:hypothetical protein
MTAGKSSLWGQKMVPVEVKSYPEIIPGQLFTL